AAVNSSTQCVVSGEASRILSLQQELANIGVASRLLSTERAFHSHMVEPILDEFTDFMKGIRLCRPLIPYISNLTGTWILPEQACAPSYWAGQLRGVVRFADGIREIDTRFRPLFLDVGPGQSLARLINQQTGVQPDTLAIGCVRERDQDQTDIAVLLNAVGSLWLNGGVVDWQAFYGGNNRRVELPEYPFERSRYWVEPGGRSRHSDQSAVNGASEIEFSDLAEPGRVESKAAIHPRPALPVPYVAPRNQTEKIVTSVWQALLGIDRIGIQDNFFDLGGDSLMALQAISQINAKLGTQIPVVSLYEGLTIRALGELVAETLLNEERPRNCDPAHNED